MYYICETKQVKEVIVEVKYTTSLDSVPALGLVRSREELISDINSGIQVLTKYKKDGVWTEGSKVIIKAGKWITTVHDGTDKDNLDELPRYI